MIRQLERRISRLESAHNASPPVGLPMLIVARVGESEESAIMRICGPQGLPQRAPQDGPHLIIIPVASARSTNSVAADNE
jgi:hypothetical protein